MDSDSDNNHPLGLLDAPDEESSDEEDEEQRFDEFLQRVHQNDPFTTVLDGSGSYARIQNMTDDEWGGLGRDISDNTHLKTIYFHEGALSDNRMSFLFQGLTRSVTIKHMDLSNNELSAAGVRSMVPFLQNANNLNELHLHDNSIQSEGFSVLFRALCDSPIEYLNCSRCGVESIQIDNDYFPKHLKYLDLYGNNINTDGCRGLRKLLQGGDATLTTLRLEDNNIGDEGVAILVDALQHNTSLKNLFLRGNDDISKQGQIMLLKLVNNICCIGATLHSNHTLRYIHVNVINPEGLLDTEEIQTHIDMATGVNRFEDNPEAAGREKKFTLSYIARREQC